MSLLALDFFLFEVDHLAFSQLQRSQTWKHPENSRVGARNATQYTGEGDDTITLTGVLYFEIGDPNSIQTLRDLAAEGGAYPLVDGAGEVYGAWTIQALDTTASFHFPNGTPRKTEFTLTLKHAADDLVTVAT